MISGLVLRKIHGRTKITDPSYLFWNKTSDTIGLWDFDFLRYVYIKCCSESHLCPILSIWLGLFLVWFISTRNSPIHQTQQFLIYFFFFLPEWFTRWHGTDFVCLVGSFFGLFYFAKKIISSSKNTWFISCDAVRTNYGTILSDQQDVGGPTKNICRWKQNLLVWSSNFLNKLENSTIIGEEQERVT